MSRLVTIGKRTLSVPWSPLDRAIEAVAPQWAVRRFQARVQHTVFEAYGGGYSGASVARRSLAGWNPLGGDADAQLLTDLPTLRERSRDLARNAPIAAGAIGTSVTNVVGTGLTPRPQPDAAFLGLDANAAAEWATNTLREFELWATSAFCDLAEKQTFYAQQPLVFRSVLEAGDHAVVTTRNAESPLPVKLALQHLEADRLCNSDRKPDSATLVAGVEMNAAGAPRAYHFASGHPLRRSGSGALKALTWRVIPAYSGRRRNVLHTFERLRAGQTRGIPMLAPVIEPLKQLEQYTEAELMAAVVSGLFTVFIKGGAPATIMPSAVANAGSATPATATDSTAAGSGWNTKLGNGLVVELGQGEDISSANPGRPNAQFDPFVTSVVRQIGLALQIPYEVLVKHYTASYSAARAAMLDAWRFWRVRRQWLVDEFCQPVYQAWLDEAVALGRISAMGYFADEAVRQAWSKAVWTGDGPGSIDPLKEALAAKERVALPISTLDQESILHDGVPFADKLVQRQREREQLEAAGLPDPSAANAKPEPAAPNNNEPPAEGE